jgi:hypothetical protein
MFEALESRRLMSIVLTALGGQAEAGFVWQQQEDGHDTLINNTTGRSYRLPTVKPDGSVILPGTPEADQISVERVTGIDSAHADLLHLVYLDTPEDAPVAVVPGVLNVEWLRGMVERERGILAEREARLAELIGQSAEQWLIDLQNETIDVSNRIIASGERMIGKLTEPTDFIRYRVEGGYEVFVEVSDGLTPSSRIRIDAGGGADVVNVANNVPIRTTVMGGAGADKLTSGSKRTLLSGGGGRDRLFSRSRHGGTLDGGAGADRYYNRFGEVQIAARCDGDCLMVNGSAVPVTQPGVFGLSGTSSSSPGKCYFFTEGDQGQTDLLA